MCVRGTTTATFFAVWLTLCLSPNVRAEYARSKAALRAFIKVQACPATGEHRFPCPGYVVDHIKALACGGADSPENMQWQTREEAKAKDRWELKECGK